MIDWWRDPKTGNLFVFTPECNCAAPDNGVGVQHEPACGWEQYGEADDPDPPGEPVKCSPWDYGSPLDFDALLGMPMRRDLAEGEDVTDDP